MKIAVAADHRGYEAKQRIIPWLTKAGHEMNDCGCHSTTACDYIDFAIPAAHAVTESHSDCAILIDGSGIGMSITANKIRGIRAALAHDEITARIAREHNHSNILCLGSDLLSDAQLRKIIQVFLATPFGEGRHARRVAKLTQLEKSQMGKDLTA